MASSVFLDAASGITIIGGPGGTILFPVGSSGTITQNGIGVTSTDGLILQNTTDAAAGVQQISPRVRFHGEGWKTDATAGSQVVDVINELLPVQGASEPTANLLWKYAVNGGAYGTIMTLTSVGDISVPGSLISSNGNITASNGTLTAGNVAGTLALLVGGGGVAGGPTGARMITKVVTGIADAVATAVLTVTVPNANHAACIQVRFLSSNGSTDAFESSRCAEGLVVLARTTGVATVAVAATLEMAAIATVAAGATHTLAYSVSAMTGAVGATQTFTINVTIDDSGNLGGSVVTLIAEVLNSQATGVTIA